MSWCITSGTSARTTNDWAMWGNDTTATAVEVQSLNCAWKVSHRLALNSRIGSSPVVNVPAVSQEFSPHLNASDMLADFAKFAASKGIPQGEVLQLPIELFLSWLIIEAAKRNDETPPDDVIPPEKRLHRMTHPRCLHCGRFIPKSHSDRFCSPLHGAKYYERLALTT